MLIFLLFIIFTKKEIFTAFKNNFSWESPSTQCIKIIIKETYYNTILTSQNKPANYIQQLENIDKIFHNDYNRNHFFLDEDKIKLIDWNNTALYKPLKKRWVNDIYKEIERLR